MFKRTLLVGATLLAPIAGYANVITDWDEKAVSVVQGNAVVPPPTLGGASGGARIMSIVHIAMFEAVNAVDRHYQSYKLDSKVDPGCSQQAAAASAAVTVLAKLVPDSAAKMKQEFDTYLAGIPAGEGKDRGVKMGEEIAVKVIALRAKDGFDKVNAYRPVTTPGVYVQTMPTVSWEFADMPPFAMTSPSQFRPPPPPPLSSEQWAKDYNEIKDVGEKNSTKRTARQTEDALFWLVGGPSMYQPIPRQIVTSKNMSVIDSAHFMAVVATAQSDAYIAVFDAKYKYEFWRPITAIRNGDIDDNPATERVAAWQPLGPTPTHPEYPCAHCIQSGAMGGAIAAMLGTEDIPEVTLTSSSAPGVTHKFTNLRAMNDEASAARIYAGFHYRNSTEVGSNMGWKIGAYVVQTCMQPLVVAAK
jgi:PAP2 superfamily